ncbi:MAG: hypothetical protein N3B14_09805, partial [Thermoleophilia bacterium]|nr:hypothetical protein [Thermoleophilia bacterium]
MDENIAGSVGAANHQGFQGEGEATGQPAQKSPQKLADRYVIRGTGLIGPFDSGPPALVDVKDGRITRIRPLRYDL